MKTIAIGAHQFAVRDAGQGPVLLLVHGFPLSHRMWEAQIEGLSPQHRVIAPDLRGFGGSSVDAGAMSMDDYADDLANVLDALHIAAPVTLCGFSMGGYVALAFYRRHGARVGSLVLCNSRAAADTPDAAQKRHELAERVLQEGPEAVAQQMLPKLLAAQTFQQRPELVEKVRQMILATAPEGIAAALRGMAARPDSRDLLRQLRVPTRLVAGEYDTLTPPEEMRAMAAEIPQATFRQISGAAHLTPMEQPGPVNSAIVGRA